MKKNYTRITLVGILAGFGLLLSQAEAQTTYTVGVNAAGATNISAVAVNDLIDFVAAEDRSYCCSINSSTAGANIRFSTVYDTPGETPDYSDYPINARGDWEPLLGTGPAEARACLSTAKDYLAPAAPYDLPRLRITHDAGGPVPAGVICYETTLFGGFNTFVTDFNFLELTNTTNSDITVDVVAFNSVTGSQTPIVSQNLTLKANSRKDLDIHSAAGSGAYGPVLVMHNGTPGSVIAILNQYKITATSPTLTFDPVATVVFKTRKELSGG